MQWFYGPTWGSTLRICQGDNGKWYRPDVGSDTLGKPKRSEGPCVRWNDLHSRQMELFEVLRRNALHAQVAQVHLLVSEAAPIERFLEHLPWHLRHGRSKIRLVQIAGRPTFRTYIEHISKNLLNHAVVITNQDIFLDTGWSGAAHALAPRSAFFLSRYHERVEYDVGHSLAAAAATGHFNLTQPNSAAIFSARQRRSGAEGTRRLRQCDMSGPKFARWSRSLCTTSNYGSYDAYALRLDKPLTEGELDLFDYPQNAWGGENVLLYILLEALHFRLSNPCLTLKIVHVHCEMPTNFGPRVIGDQRLGKKQVAIQVQTKMRRLGLPVTIAAENIGTLALNVTALSGGNDRWW